MERFWSKVDVRGYEECWLWVGALTGGRGYGSFHLDRRRVKAHRFAYEQMVGPIPDGLTLDHLCRVRRCVNPNHLEPVTNLENIRRGRSFAGRVALRETQTHCKRGHELAGNNLHMRSDGRRQCLTCRRDGEFRRYHAKKS